MYDVIVVGGGVIGLSIALELHSFGSILVLERDLPGQGTSWAAAGMLSPQSEADEEGSFFRLCMASLKMFPEWAQKLNGWSGIDSECDRCGLIVLADSDDELKVLEARCRWQQSAGLHAEILSPAEVYKLEPLITAKVKGGLYLLGDYRVTPRRLTDALIAACTRTGIEIRTESAVDAVTSARGRVSGVRSGQQTLEARRVVVAGGVRSGEIEGLSPSIPLSPRKGQILSISSPPGSFSHMIRWRHSYFVPRRDGEIVIGATNEDVGFDRSLTPAGVGGLLTEAQQISSHVESLPIRETWTGLRPATPDGLPVIGSSNIEGLLYALGHYRNGILLSPITASIIGALVRGEPSPVAIDPYTPSRFTES